MVSIERLWNERNRNKVLAISGVIILVIAIVDWRTKPYVSLGFLYLFPIMFAAAFLPRWLVALIGFVCALLAELFSSLDPSLVRLTFVTLALVGCGLFVAELVRNRRLSLESVELLSPRNGSLIGDPVAAFLPELHHALRWEEAAQFRASMQCRGHRGNGEAFTADVWFSTYKEGSKPKLAAIIADVSEEAEIGLGAAALGPASEGREGNGLNARETDVLRLLVQGLANKEIAARMEISESTVKNTIQQLFAKTGVRTRSQLVRVALEQFRAML
jgi:DNA-binding CsgD family transcriptional regulator